MQRVVAAVIMHQGKVFCAKRPPGKVLGGLWEFPGGKVEPGETLEEALHREIQEELGLGITIQEPLLTVVHQYPTHQVEVHTYLCEWASGDVVLHVHTDAKWLRWDALDQLDWVAADDPIIAHLKKKLGDA